ncbi:hypothetical protein [Propionimicrobium sp. PCR01-08-3]|nr:hypothetical protein [Propionimicrobium sp. PCR01-08-3]WIY82478.1 hypothetical protein QQ658_13395 [Propionimicrobium sp. PCR01-08-3]
MKASITAAAIAKYAAVIALVVTTFTRDPWYCRMFPWTCWS